MLKKWWLIWGTAWQKEPTGFNKKGKSMAKNEFRNWFDFSGKSVVITGGAGLLGGEMCLALAKCGANITILDRVETLPMVLADQLVSLGCDVLLLQSDVMDKTVLEKNKEDIISRWGKIDILINAAGGNHPKATTNPEHRFFDLPQEALQFTFDLNLLGTILPSQVFGAVMAEQGEGIILNISSMNAFRPLTRIPAYSAAKAGVSNFTQWLAVHMAQEYSPKIRVNAIAPGFFLTDQNRFLLTEKETGELTPRGQTILNHTPMGRFGDPDDLTGTLLWLLSPASEFVTGIVVPVDGGFSAFSGV